MRDEIIRRRSQGSADGHRPGAFGACRLIAAFAALALVCFPTVARAHIGDQFDSVHFHSGNPDFGTVPRRGCVHGELDDRELHHAYGMGGGRDDGVELTAEGYEKALDAREKMRENLLQSAEAYRKAGEWARALRTYEWATRRFRPRGSVRDRIEVLRRVVSMPAPLPPAFVGALRLYLDGMAAL